MNAHVPAVRCRQPPSARLPTRAGRDIPDKAGKERSGLLRRCHDATNDRFRSLMSGGGR